MTALDIGARGLAQRARQAFARTDENSASMAQRSEPTAAAFEALAAEYSLLTGEAGATYTFDTTAYPVRPQLLIRGNGAELRNVNGTPVDVDNVPSSLLALGISMVWMTPHLSYHAVESASGPKLTLPSGAGSNFAPGDLVVLHGATKYSGAGNEYDVYRNYLRARVVEATEDHVVIDRAMPAQLLADSPVIGNAAEDLPASSPALGYYMLYAPHIFNIRLSSDLGEALRFGGTIDGTFRDLIIDARSAITLNAMQDCLFENIRFRAWRVICELAEGSYGTVVRNMRGSLTDASTRFGGAPDLAPFFIGIGENSSECVFEDFAVDSGPNDTSGGAGVILVAGRNNEVRNSRLRFPALTAPALSIQTVPDPNHPTVDCGFRNLTVTAPSCSQFFSCSDSGGGIVRPYLEDSRFYGTPSLRAGTLRGADGWLSGNFFERGDVYLDAATVGWRVEGNTINGSMVFQGGTNNVVRGNFIRDGFSGLSNTLLRTNAVADNESDARRRLAAAAHASALNSTIVTTSPNAVYASATFAAGDLEPGDRIFLRSTANTGGSGATHTKNARVSLFIETTSLSLGSRSVTSASAPFGVDCVLEIVSNAFIAYTTLIGGVPIATATVIIPPLDTHGLTVNLEYWMSNAEEAIAVRSARIVAVKPGMRHLPLR